MTAHDAGVTQKFHQRISLPRLSAVAICFPMLHARVSFGQLAVFAACLTLLRGSTPPAHSAEAGWKAGTASTVITPEKPLWMAGYGGRTRHVWRHLGQRPCFQTSLVGSTWSSTWLRSCGLFGKRIRVTRHF